MAEVEVSKEYLYFSTENKNPLCLPWVFSGKALHIAGVISMALS